MQQNVSNWERVASVAAGSLLLAVAVRRPGARKLAAPAAAGLLARGLAGYCPVSALTGRQPSSDTRGALRGRRGIHVRESITIGRSPGEVYRYWRNLENLPRFMTHLDRVEVKDAIHSHWEVAGPGGVCVQWDAEIINDVPNELLGWRSLEGSDVTSAGSVQFRPGPRGGTEVTVHLQYAPPAGKLGSWVAAILGSDPSKQIREDLRRLKQVLEPAASPAASGQAGDLRVRLGDLADQHQ